LWYNLHGTFNLAEHLQCPLWQDSIWAISFRYRNCHIPTDCHPHEVDIRRRHFPYPWQESNLHSPTHTKADCACQSPVAAISQYGYADNQWHMRSALGVQGGLPPRPCTYGACGISARAHTYATIRGHKFTRPRHSYDTAALHARRRE
jgi:hypothetical protein